MPNKTYLRMRLKKDIVIPAGTVLDTAPTHCEYAPGHFDHIVGLTKDTTGIFRYYVDFGDPAVAEWFEEV